MSVNSHMHWLEEVEITPTRDTSKPFLLVSTCVFHEELGVDHKHTFLSERDLFYLLACP